MSKILFVTLLHAGGAALPSEPRVLPAWQAVPVLLRGPSSKKLCRKLPKSLTRYACCGVSLDTVKVRAEGCKQHTTLLTMQLLIPARTHTQLSGSSDARNGKKECTTRLLDDLQLPLQTRVSGSHQGGPTSLLYVAVTAVL